MRLFLLLLILFPALAAFTHDAWFYYQDPSREQMFSDFGFIWINYLPEFYESIRDKISDETWKQFIVPLLTTPAVIVAVGLACIIVGLLVLFKILGYVCRLFIKGLPKRKTYQDKKFKEMSERERMEYLSDQKDRNFGRNKEF